MNCSLWASSRSTFLLNFNSNKVVLEVRCLFTITYFHKGTRENQKYRVLRAENPENRPCPSSVLSATLFSHFDILFVTGQWGFLSSPPARREGVAMVSRIHLGFVAASAASTAKTAAPAGMGRAVRSSLFLVVSCASRLPNTSIHDLEG